MLYKQCNTSSHLQYAEHRNSVNGIIMVNYWFMLYMLYAERHDLVLLKMVNYWFICHMLSVSCHAIRIRSVRRLDRLFHVYEELLFGYDGQLYIICIIASLLMPQLGGWNVLAISGISM